MTVRITSSQREQFLRTGVVKLEGLLSESQLRECRQKYDWSMAHPTKQACNFYENTGFYNDMGSLSRDKLKAAESLAEMTPLVTNGPFADACMQLWGSDRVWFLDFELFRKRKGPGRTKTPFHQDTPSAAIRGGEMIGFWICFQDIPKSSCLEVVSGSHNGPMYDGTPFIGDDDTAPMFGDNGTYQLPRLPDVEALRAAGKVEILSWDLKPGDVIAFHLNALHGGAPSSEACPERNTLVLRFFGEQCLYNALPLRKPGKELPKQHKVMSLPSKPFPWLRNVKDGDPFHLAGPNKFIQVRGAAPVSGAAAPTHARL